MMYQQYTSLLLLTASATVTSRHLQRDTMACLLANPEDYATCCQDAPDSAVCTYVACEIGAISEGCDCTTMANFCNSLATLEDIVVPEICVPSLECCSEGMHDEDFQKCVSEKGGDEILPTSFFELNADLIAEEMSMSMAMGVEIESATKVPVVEQNDETIDKTEDAAVVAAKATSSSSRYMAGGRLSAVAFFGLIKLIW
eukprot:CCRYP_013510-RB/>CCRYP_013510-RB protein AED:0.06 eAED:0.06 QI:122/1/1/1/0/0/3/697/199